MRNITLTGTATLAALALFAGTGTAAPLPGFVLAAQTAKISFYTRGNEKVDVRKSEQYLEEVEKLLGNPLPGRAEYYRYGTPEELAAGTGTYARGVTFAATGQIHSTEPFHAHEIVHLVAGRMGDPGSFFQEGLAVALGNRSKWNGQDVDRLAKGVAKAQPLASLIAGFDRMDAQVSYPVAGSFVASLIKTHGIDKVAEFFRACTPGGANRQAAFASVFGQSLDAAGAAWAASL